MLANRRVKIVATIGPATCSKENLKKAIEAGMNVARLNFSHGSHADHLPVIKAIRELSQELKAPVAILQDLQGPKIRVGKFEKGSIELVPDEIVKINTELEFGSEGMIPTDFKNLPSVCKVGTKILLDDGILELSVTAQSDIELECRVVFGGTLKDRKGMNIPGVLLPIDCMTSKDLEDLEFGLQQDVDYVALSFVRESQDILKLREIINQKKPGTQIIAKIEMVEAIENLEEILEYSDGVMVARGDLAVEIGQTLLPGVQKKIINLANKVGKPVITATQMLESMVANPRPTRAEITDVANAVMDGSDALMLSAESATGKHPFKAIQTMSEIALEIEKEGEYFNSIDLENNFLSISEGIGVSACLTAMKLNASAIVCLTTTGKTAKIISSYRPRARLIAVTHLMDTLNRLELNWGVQTFNIYPYKSTDEAMSQIEALLLKFGLVSEGDHVVLTLGVPVLERSKTNSLRVYTIGAMNSEPLSKEELPLRCQENPQNSID